MSKLSAEEALDFLTEASVCQNLVEGCFRLYMKPEEIIEKLKNEAKIRPAVTESVLQKMEEQNPDFFAAYKLWLIMRDQIERFNQQLEKLANLMRQTQIIQNRACANVVGSASAPLFNGGETNLATFIGDCNAIGEASAPPFSGGENNFTTFIENCNVVGESSTTTFYGGETNITTSIWDCNVGQAPAPPFNGGETSFTTLTGDCNVVGEASAPPFNGGETNLTASTDIHESFSVSQFLVDDAGSVAPDISRPATTSDPFIYDAFDSDNFARLWP
ncbi:hypothetical protein ACS0TY_024845 [Phlomoides rotata]